MAKALLMLTATEGNRAALQQALADSLEAVFAERDQLTVQLMKAPDTDFFYDPQSPYARPELVVEVITAPGKPLSTLHQELVAVMAGLPIKAESQAFVMLERKYIVCQPQQYYYHYLMLKRPEFSAADYRDYYSNFHANMGRHTVGIAGYSQNDIDPPASAELANLLGLSTRDVTSISELKMPDPEAFISNPETMAVAEPAAIDEERFLDRANSVSFTSQVILRLGDFERIQEPVFPQHFAPD